jgi:hypothetical protein
VNNHKIASKVSGEQKEKLIEELYSYQDASAGDGKRMATKTEDIKEMIGRSPDNASAWFMRMYFVVRERIAPGNSEERSEVVNKLQTQFARNISNQSANSSR